MSAPYKYLRDTISGVTQEFDEKTAKRYLAHPVFSKRLIEVDSPKDEVLSEPYVIGDDGERELVDPPKTKTAPKKGEK